MQLDIEVSPCASYWDIQWTCTWNKYDKYKYKYNCEETNVLCNECMNEISDFNPYSGVELQPWTFQWDLTLHSLIWTVSHINRSLHQIWKEPELIQNQNQSNFNVSMSNGPWPKFVNADLYMQISMYVFSLFFGGNNQRVTNSENALDILNSLEFYKIFTNCLLIHYYMSWYSDINVTVNCPENNCATLV